MLDRPATAAELTTIWLGGLLEMPPAVMQSLVVDVVTALRRRNPEEVERFRSLVARGCARFHIPQMDRLTRLFEDITAQMGGPSSWQ
ncbi:hypothetical protein [Pseudonocardia kunmingensis]|uniref:hypothetical protein n=1 Tax=Pseudonocardia kunmingensis TaxID=630975 RepID=UPI00114F671D|nr:hypothetical protein [Pseudonocardia kunmingensis]